MDREESWRARLPQALTGHGCFPAFLHTIGKQQDDYCCYCGERDGAEHTLFVCEEWDKERLALMQKTTHWHTMENFADILLQSGETWDAFACSHWEGQTWTRTRGGGGVTPQCEWPRPGTRSNARSRVPECGYEGCLVGSRCCQSRTYWYEYFRWTPGTWAVGAIVKYTFIIEMFITEIMYF
jgi:hypothetical protein